MKRMIKLWAWISQLGTASIKNDVELLRIKILNRALVALTVIILISLLLLSLTIELLVIHYTTIFALIVVFLGCLYLISRGIHSIARHITIGVFICIVITWRVFIGGNYVDQLFPLIPAIVITYFLFNQKWIIRYNILALAIIVADIVRYYLTYSTPDNNYVIAIFLFFVTLLAQILFLEFFRRLNIVYQVKLQESNIFLNAILNATSDGIVAINAKAGLQTYNQKAVDMWNIPNNMIENYNPQKQLEYVASQLKHPTPEEFLLEREKAIADPTYVSTEVLELQSGIMLKRYSSPLAINDTVVGRVISYRDVTEVTTQLQQIKKLLDEQKNNYIVLEKANKNLKRSNKDLEQFAYAASHDLQEPLRMIGNFVQLLQEDMGNRMTDEEKMYVQYIVDGVTRMGLLIDDLLKYSRVGADDKEFLDFNLKTVIEKKLADLSPIIQEKKASIHIKRLPDIIYGIPSQLGLVFYNLINNGIKFNTASQPEITIKCEEREFDYLFSIADNGIGINENNHKKIFGIFKRLHRKEIYQGTGVGLALVNRIILKHNGEIWLESKLGSGTTFFFTIPKRQV